MEINHNIKQLIQKFVLNQCSPEEIEELVRYFKKGRITDEFPQTEEVLGMLEKLPEMSDNDAQRIYDQIIRKAKSQEKPHKKTYFYKYAAVAAMLLMVFGGTYFYNSTNISLNNSGTVSAVPENAIILETAADKKLVLSEDGQLRLTDDKGEVIGSQKGNQLVYTSNEKRSGAIQYNTLSIPYGKRFSVQLSDGSSVTLNAGSSLRYPVNFSGANQREVFLTGEAFFKVVKDNKRPFFVKAEGLEVGVLGTEFNVSAYPEDATSKVVLVEGSVKLKADQKSTIMKPGELANLKRDNNALEIHKVDTNLYTIWMQGGLVFRNMSFEDILKKMERHYDVKIINNNKELATEKFNASFDEEPLIKILEYFKQTYGLSYTQKDDNTIIINSKQEK
ncbi:FecR family protein [Galbibacter sp.]|uniref:FecR family protein n=1 Tax=Galbibacter sp. TaxID=2918471 RepID=UPI003A8E58E6